jgi:LAS superfamily LD-carboxypeptidase LdcB
MFEEPTVQTILEKVEGSNLEKPCLKPAELNRVLDDGEQRMIQQVYRVNPDEYGLTIEYYGEHGQPANLVEVPRQTLVSSSQQQYLPRPTLNAFQQLHNALKQATDDSLVILSGYRSPTRQATLFLAFLDQYGYDLHQTLRRVVPPGYSQHGHPDKQAIDITTGEQATSPEGFAKSAAYDWLKENADTHGFRESYAENNDVGLMHEPWHWSHHK